MTCAMRRMNTATTVDLAEEATTNTRPFSVSPEHCEIPLIGERARRAALALVATLVREARYAYTRGSGSGNVHPEYRDGQANAYFAAARMVAFAHFGRTLRLTPPGE